MPPISENDLIARIRKATRAAGTARGGELLGIGDDAALWRPSPGHEAVLSCDWFLEGTHFVAHTHPPDSVGWKCLARALGDIAAMGAVPRFFLLSLALPVSHFGKWLDEFLRGLRRASLRFECPLAGGDTTRDRRVLISVTVIGEVKTGRAMRRSGARPRDVVFVTGRLGEADYGLRMIRKHRGRVKARDPILRKHLYPEPRLSVAQWLGHKRLASAMMDVSDGLSTDLARLCEASGVGSRVYAAQIPTLLALRQAGLSGENALNLALHGGDDYELLFTVPKTQTRSLPESFSGVALTAIGEITASRNIVLVNKAGIAQQLRAGGWDPFVRPGEKETSHL